MRVEELWTVTTTRNSSWTSVLVTTLYTKFPIKIAHIPEHFAGYGLKGMLGGKKGKEVEGKFKFNLMIKLDQRFGRNLCTVEENMHLKKKLGHCRLIFYEI